MTDQPPAPTPDDAIPPSAPAGPDGPEAPAAPIGPVDGSGATSAIDPGPATAGPTEPSATTEPVSGAVPAEPPATTEPTSPAEPPATTEPTSPTEPPATTEPVSGAVPAETPAFPAAAAGSARSDEGAVRTRRSPLALLGYLLAIVAGAALAVGALAASGSLSVGPSPSPSPSSSPEASPSPVAGAGYEDGRSVGDPAAPVTVEIWADFQCPYCGLQARAIGPTIERTYAATGKARVTYRDLVILGQESLDAAVAARCAEQQGRFWYMHDLLFASQQGENQGAFSADRLKQIAAFAGLDAASFATCLADPSVAQAARDESAEGTGLLTASPSPGASPTPPSTPQIRIVGPGGVQIVKGLQPFSAVEAAFALASTPRPSSSPDSSPTGSPGPGTSSGPSPSVSPQPSASPSP